MKKVTVVRARKGVTAAELEEFVVEVLNAAKQQENALNHNALLEISRRIPVMDLNGLVLQVAAMTVLELTVIRLGTNAARHWNATKALAAVRPSKKLLKIHLIGKMARSRERRGRNLNR